MASPKKKGWREVVIAGGFAGACARTVVAPIERLKILYQIKSGDQEISALLRDLVQKEGLRKMWKGNSAAVIRVVPYLSLQFVSYEKYKGVLREAGPPTVSPVLIGLGAGSLAGVTAVCATYPLDVVRARMALQTEGIAQTSYRNMFDALVGVGRTEGARALYRGLAATVVGAAPYTGLKFGFYEFFKLSWCEHYGIDENQMHGGVRVGAGATAGLLALSAVYPFDVIRRRMQTHKGGARYPSVWSAIVTIAQKEGVRRGLYRGLSLNYLKTIPNVAIYMSLYDITVKWLGEREHEFA